jgi:hypothetical protein
MFYGWNNLPYFYPVNIDIRKQIPPSIVGDNYTTAPKEKREMYLGKLILNDLSPYLSSLTATVYYIQQEREQDSRTLQFTKSVKTGRKTRNQPPKAPPLCYDRDVCTPRDVR